MGSYLFLWQMFSNIKIEIKYLKCSVQKVLKTSFWQQPCGKNQFICNLFIIACFSPASKSLVSGKKPSDAECLFMLNTYP